MTLLTGWVKKSAVALLSETHESEDDSDYPNDIVQLIGAEFAFELKSHTYYNHGTYESFTVSRVVTTPIPKKGLHQITTVAEGSTSSNGIEQGNERENGALLTPPTTQAASADTIEEVEDGSVPSNPLKRLGIDIEDGN